MAAWGEFSAATLAALRSRLDTAGYARLAEWPWFASRRRHPWRDHEVERRTREGRAIPLASHSCPSRFLKGLPLDLQELHELFWQHGTVAAEPGWEDLRQGGVLELEQGRLRSLVQVACLPGGTYLLSSVARRSPGEFVYLGDDTGLLLDEAGSTRGGRLLDMCCGGGGVSLGLSAHFGDTLGVDLNPNAIALARSNALLNGRPVAYKISDLWSQVEGRFDFVIGNPPALPLVSSQAMFAFGGDVSTALTLRLLQALPDHLEPGGQALFLTFSPGELLWKDLALPSDYSVEYKVRARFRLNLSQLEVLDHVFLWVRNDGRGQRQRVEPGWKERLRQWSWPWLRGESTVSRLP